MTKHEDTTTLSGVGSSDVLAACEWEYDDADADVWATSCGNMFVFIVDGPKENGMNFCPYCGKPLSAADNAVLSGAATEVKPRRDVCASASNTRLER